MAQVSGLNANNLTCSKERGFESLSRQFCELLRLVLFFLDYCRMFFCCLDYDVWFCFAADVGVSKSWGSRWEWDLKSETYRSDLVQSSGEEG